METAAYYTTKTEYIEQVILPALADEASDYDVEAIADQATDYTEGKGFFQVVDTDEFWEIVATNEA